MTKLDYLLKCSPQELFDTWYVSGQVTIDNNTKFYSKDTIIRVNNKIDPTLITPTSQNSLQNYFLYVAEEYIVDNKTKFAISWEEMTKDDVEGLYVANQGISLPYFVVLPHKWKSSFIPTPNYVPYQNDNITTEDGGINIDDSELELILSEIGFPFVTFADIELARNQITRVCIKAALQKYYSYRPIIKEEQFGSVSIGSEFDLPLPENAFRAVPYYTTPGGYSSVGSGSPFAFYNEQIVFSGGVGGGLGGGRFGKPIRYNKPVPGYAGLDENTSFLDAMAMRQGYLNYFRREKYKMYRNEEDGLQHIKGFSTIGGILNVKWLCWDNDWSHIPLDDVIVFARPMAKIEVLNNIGMIRSLVKTDIAGQLDATVLTNRAKELNDKLEELLKSIGLTGYLAIQRGGG